MGMRKSLTVIGNSLGIIIDKPVAELLHFGRDTVVDIELRDGALVITPVHNVEKRRRVREIGKKVMDDHDEAFKKLAK